jgi:hypothetical protein
MSAVPKYSANEFRNALIQSKTNQLELVEKVVQLSPEKLPCDLGDFEEMYFLGTTNFC